MLDNVCSASGGVWALHARNMHVSETVLVCVCLFCACAGIFRSSIVHILPPSRHRAVQHMCLPLIVLLRQPKLLLTRLLRRNHISATFWQPLFFTYTHTHTQRKTRLVTVCYCTCLTCSRCPWCSVSPCFFCFFCFAFRHVFPFSKFHGLTTLKRFHKVQPQQVARLHLHSHIHTYMYAKLWEGERITYMHALMELTRTYISNTICFHAFSIFTIICLGQCCIC